MTEAKRDFKGIWIEKELYLVKGLSWTEKLLYKEIESLDNERGCFASNAHLANFLGVKETTISNAISKLKDLNLVKEESFDGRIRTLRSYPENLKTLESRLLKTIRQTFKNYKESNTTNNKEDFSFSKEKEIGVLRTPNPLSPKPYTRRNLKIPKSDDNNIGVMKVFDYWNSKGSPLTKHGLDKKVGKEALQAIADKLNNGTKPQDIMTAIDRYYEVLKSSDTMISPSIAGHKVSLAEFFGFNGYTKKVLMPKQKNPLNIKSWFQECSSGEDLIGKFAKPVKAKADENPELTKKIESKYTKRFLHTAIPNYTQKELNKFITCSEGIVAFGVKVKDEHGGRISQNILVSCLFEALKERWGDKIEIGNLSSNHTFDRVLPTYLERQGIFEWTESKVDFVEQE